MSFVPWSAGKDVRVPTFPVGSRRLLGAVSQQSALWFSSSLRTGIRNCLRASGVRAGGQAELLRKGIKSLPSIFILRHVRYCKDCLENTDVSVSQCSRAEQAERAQSACVAVTVEQVGLMTKGFEVCVIQRGSSRAMFHVREIRLQSNFSL